MNKIFITHPEIENYCQAHTTELSPIFQKLKEKTYAQMNAPQMQVGPLEGAFLKFLVSLSQAKFILEIGTFTGYSALAMAEGLPSDGKIITCDIDPNATEIAQEFWSQSEHGKKIELKLGKALDTIAQIEKPIDLVFIDADKNNYLNYWEACMPKLRSGGMIIVDNVLWSGRVLSPEEPRDQAIADFNTHAHKDSRVSIVTLPIRDGILLARKH